MTLILDFASYSNWVLQSFIGPRRSLPYKKTFESFAFFLDVIRKL